MNSVMIQLQRYKLDLEARGHYVYAIMLKGSQNYNLHDSESDIDANAILIPSLSEIRNNKSYKYTYDTGEVTCHNIYTFAEIVAKGNPQWIETIHTPYHIGWSLELFKHFKVNPSALKGMVYEKVAAFDKLYPSRAHMIEKHGYDPKQLSSIIRLYHLLLINKEIYTYKGNFKEWMIAVKRGSLNKTDAVVLLHRYKNKITKIYEKRKVEYKLQCVNYKLIDSIVLNYLITICDSHKLAYKPQTVNYEAIDKIVLDYYLTTHRP